MWLCMCVCVYVCKHVRVATGAFRVFAHVHVFLYLLNA